MFLDSKVPQNSGHYASQETLSIGRRHFDIGAIFCAVASDIGKNGVSHFLQAIWEDSASEDLALESLTAGLAEAKLAKIRATQ